MNLLKSIIHSIDILKRDPLPTENELRIRDEQRIRMICSRHSRGNISLKSGKYMTTADLEARRQANLALTFSE